jgi:hypothetical protein
MYVFAAFAVQTDTKSCITCLDQESVHGAALAAKNSGVQNACHVAGRNGVEAQYINSVS